MNVLYLILLIIAAVCFVASALVVATPTTATPSPVTRVNLVALGLFFWVLVPLIQTIDRL